MYRKTFTEHGMRALQGSGIRTGFTKYYPTKTISYPKH
jgi:hypothetical protein